jgi:hypothetical protein
MSVCYITEYTICSLVLHGKSQWKASFWDSMSHTVLRGWWCDDVLNVHAPSQDIYMYDDSQESFCKELEHVFDQFPKHHIKILLREFSATLQRPYNCGRWDHCAISKCRQMNVKWQSITTCHKLIAQDTFTLTIGNECAGKQEWQWWYSKCFYIQKSNCQEYSVALFKPWSMQVNPYWWEDSPSDQTGLDERRYSYLTSIISEELPVIMITIC